MGFKKYQKVEAVEPVKADEIAAAKGETDAKPKLASVKPKSD